MDPSTIAFLKGAVAFVLVAGTGLTIARLWLQERRRSRPDADRIIDVLREENAALQAELGARMVELEERVDFVERRIARAPRVEPLPEGRITTPV
jgi:hypothetical protein